jgi:hypothetical protein
VSDYSKWEFMLDGDTQDFRQLSERPGTAYFNIYGGIDHWNDCRNDDFRMTTLYCEDEADPKIIWQIGYELLSLFNGASILLNKDYRKASIYKLLYEEREVDYVAPWGRTALLGPAPFSRQRIESEFERCKGTSVRFPLLHLAAVNKDVYFILKYLDMEPGWVTYYKLLEAVENFAKAKSITLNIDQSKRTAFTNTANNFSLSGFDSRHGFKEAVKKNHTGSMSLDDGHKFITDLVRDYFKKAVTM